MRNICKISFTNIKLNKSKLASALNKNKKQTKQKIDSQKMKMTALSTRLQLKRLIHSFQSFTISLITWVCLIYRFRCS